MPTLNRNSATLIPNLKIADSFYQRAKGLLGTKQIADNEALWITSGNSIHTFFMNYAIDCVFVDRKLVVKAVLKDIRPWRLTLPVFTASSVIEMKSGKATEINIQPGDQLHVGS
jgi:uncharacterized membrane protein (UPF0127 family)